MNLKTTDRLFFLEQSGRFEKRIVCTPEVDRVQLAALEFGGEKG